MGAIPVPPTRPPTKQLPKGPPRAADVVVSSVATHTLGIALAGGEVDALIPRGTPLPARRTDRYTTQKANQPLVTIKIVEGDATAAADNKTLNKFTLKVPPAPAGEPQILVTFDLSASGLLSVTAVDEATGHRHSISVEGANMAVQERVVAKEKVAVQVGQRKAAEL